MKKRRTFGSWLLVTALVLLCAVLGWLQYRWIGEVSAAARDRLRAGLQSGLNRVSRDFNLEIAAAWRALLPEGVPADAADLQAQLAKRYKAWQSGPYGRMFDRIAIAQDQPGGKVLQILDPADGTFREASWPGDWLEIRRRMDRRRPPAPGPGLPGLAPPPAAGLALDVPVFSAARAQPPDAPFGRREIGRVIFQVNLPFVRDVLIPELLRRDLGAAELADYRIAVFTNDPERSAVYRSDARIGADIIRGADAAATVFNLPGEPMFRPQPPAPVGEFTPPPGPPPGGPEPGRWTIFARHQAGSLEAAAARTQSRNLAVTGGVLLLLIASVIALVSFTRRTQKLAAMQIEFVAGVSHELRTPLTVLHAAGHNLQGKLAENPSQVIRYGELIQNESRRLEDLAEQVLWFARRDSGALVQKHDPVSIEAVISDTLEAAKAAIEESGCTVETKIAPDLPLVPGDAVALKHAMQNLLANALKYGAEGRWIGMSAEPARDGAEVVIRVADRGRGIPNEERTEIFEPFFRGKNALEQQIHGTGLGLNLVRRIVEAHGGSISVKSEPMQGTEFVLRLPARPAGAGA